ncbi:DNA topoisomerase IB [bacterium]|nr:MAG: DNA topoisomerase IB [bacterium]
MATRKVAPLKAKLPKIEELEIVQDPQTTAEVAGLHYVSDDEPGWTRKKHGKSFSYFDHKGAKITEAKHVERIKALAIPPAYQRVWICPDPKGHIQATGYDERGRKQYRYHPQWQQARDETKFARTLAFAAALPKIRATTEHDLARNGFPREKVLAAVVQLLEKTAIRVGNEEYARENKSIGLTTMKNRHVKVEGTRAHFHFKGKSGKWHDIDLKDRRLSTVIRKLQDLPGQSLFQYKDEEENIQHIDSSDVNAYLKDIAGEEFTAKDFRTWAGTVAASLALQELQSFDSEKMAKANIVEAVKAVATRLGNTPAVCRKSYIHPAIFEAYLDGSMLDSLKQSVEQQLEGNLKDLKPEEAAVLGLLRGRLAQKAESAK